MISRGWIVSAGTAGLIVMLCAQPVRAQTPPAISFTVDAGLPLPAVTKDASSFILAPIGRTMTMHVANTDAGASFETNGIPGTCNATECSVALPVPTHGLEKIGVNYTPSATGAAVISYPVYMLSVPTPDILPVSKFAGGLRFNLPGGYGIADVTLDWKDASTFPAAQITLHSGTGKTTPFDVTAAAIRFTANGTARFDGNIASDAGRAKLAFAMNGTGWEAAGKPTEPWSVVFGDIAAQLSGLTFRAEPNSASLSAAVTIHAPIVGDIANDALAVRIQNRKIFVAASGTAWNVKPPPLVIGPMIITAQDVSVAVDDRGQSTVSLISPVMTTNACGGSSGTLPANLVFSKSGLAGDNGTNTPLTIVKKGSSLSRLPLSIGTVCANATDLHLRVGGTPFSVFVEGSADIAASWLPGDAIRISGLKMTGSSLQGVTFEPGATVTVPNIVLGGVAIAVTKATLNGAGRLSLSAEIGDDHAKLAATWEKDGLEGTFTGAHLPVGTLFGSPQADLRGVNGSLAFHEQSRSLRIDHAVLTLPVAQSAMTLTLDQADPPRSAIAAVWDGTAWKRDAGGSARLSVGDTPPVEVGPIRFTVTKLQSDHLKDDFLSCKSSPAQLDGESGEIILCGKLELAGAVSQRNSLAAAAAAAVPSVSSAGAVSPFGNFCAYVGALYRPGNVFAFETMEKPLNDPKAAPTDPKCVNGFKFLKMFEARFVTFSLLYKLSDPDPTVKPSKSCEDDDRFRLSSQVNVTALDGVPGLNTALFDSALFDFCYKPTFVAMTGDINSLREFAVPNVVNYKISRLRVAASHDSSADCAPACTRVLLSGDDSTASFPAPFPFTVYGKGGGVEYDGKRWHTHFPGVRWRETTISFIAQLGTSGGVFSILKNGIRLHGLPKLF